MDPRSAANRELWNTWTRINVRSAFYDVETFAAGHPQFDDMTILVLRRA